MWKLYLKSEEGIAIQSSFKRLISCFDHYTENDVYVGKMKYIDYEKDKIPLSNIFYPVVHKRKSFQHEKELRAAIIKFPLREGTLDLNFEVFDAGLYVPVDLDCLIEKIYVSPVAEEWFKDLVESVMHKYALNKKVAKSSLTSDPVY
jgi:hypothetical protein